MKPQWKSIPAGSGVRQNTYQLGRGYHSQSGLRTDKYPCPLGWDPAGNIYPFSSDREHTFELWIIMLYVARNKFIKTEVLSIKGKKTYKIVVNIKS